MKTKIKDKMFTQLGQYGEDGYDGVTKAWDVVQVRLQCCGVDGWTDWPNISSDISSDTSSYSVLLPYSCCVQGLEADCGLQASEVRLPTRLERYQILCLEHHTPPGLL